MDRSKVYQYSLWAQKYSFSEYELPSEDQPGLRLHKMLKRDWTADNMRMMRHKPYKKPPSQLYKRLQLKDAANHRPPSIIRKERLYRGIFRFKYGPHLDLSDAEERFLHFHKEMQGGIISHHKFARHNRNLEKRNKRYRRSKILETLQKFDRLEVLKTLLLYPQEFLAILQSLPPEHHYLAKYKQFVFCPLVEYLKLIVTHVLCNWSKYQIDRTNQKTPKINIDFNYIHRQSSQYSAKRPNMRIKYLKDLKNLFRSQQILEQVYLKANSCFLTTASTVLKIIMDNSMYIYI